MTTSIERQPAPPSTHLDEQTPYYFARYTLGVRPWAKQREILDALQTHQRIAVKSGNGLGKGFTAAIALLWFLHTHQPAIALSTAPTFRQVRHILWRQIHNLHRRNPQTLGGQLHDTRWELAPDRYALGLSADTADQFQGFHSPNILLIVDEAEGVAEPIYEAIEAIMTTAHAQLLLIGNPTTNAGTFRRAFHQEQQIYKTITMSALDSPNLIAGQTRIPGLATKQWVQQRQQLWGTDNPLYQARVLGQFPTQSPDTLINLTHLEAATQPNHPLALDRHSDPSHRHSHESGNPEPSTIQPKISCESCSSMSESSPLSCQSCLSMSESAPLNPDEIIIAVDIARFGSDHSIILRRHGPNVVSIQSYTHLDTMTLAGHIAHQIRQHHPTQTCIDEIGIGAGIVDRLKEQGFGIRAVTVSQKSYQPHLYANLRAHAYSRLAQLIKHQQLTLPNDPQLIGQLAALRYTYDSSGRLLIESKDQIRKRGLPSPDKADALMLSVLPQPPPPKLWT